MTEVFISTGGYSGSACEFANKLVDAGLMNIELSGGAFNPCVMEDIERLLKRGAVLQPHNYFPPPESSFVFNLANPKLFDDTRAKILLDQHIEIAKICERSHIHFHAGYKRDLRPRDLGASNLDGSTFVVDHSEAFEKNLETVLNKTENENISLLLENNVLNARVFSKEGKIPFFWVDPDEILEWCEYFDNKVKLLLDVAHLKVSAKTVGFDFLDAIRRLKSITVALHASENDGITDQNEEIDREADALKAISMIEDMQFCTLEVYTESISILLDQYRLVREQLSKSKL